MKCVSLMQPWASLVVHGLKQYETRSWRTAYRGPLLIHASARLAPFARDLCESEPFATDLASVGIRSYGELPLGGIVGVVELADCIDVSALAEIGDRERAFGDFRPGRWAWLLRNARALPFAAVKGTLAIYDVDYDLEAASLRSPWQPPTRRQKVGA